MNTLEYTWEGAVMGLGSTENARGWTVLVDVDYTADPSDNNNWAPDVDRVTVVGLTHRGFPVTLTDGHKLYWTGKFEREVAYTDSFRDTVCAHAVEVEA